MKKKKNNSNQGQIDAGKDKVSLEFFDDDRLVYFLLGVAVLFVLIARIHLLSFPLERDEGEYAYMGRLILNGHLPYNSAYNMKLPGTYYIYALIMGIFGQSITGIHTGLMLVAVASMLLVFSISKHFVSKAGAVIAAASFGVIGTSGALYAQAGHATHFVAFFALLGMKLLLRMYENKRRNILWYYSAGFLFALAFICKQSGIFFWLFGLSLILVKEYAPESLPGLAKNTAVYFSGFITPVFVMLLYFHSFGDFGRFWFWTVKYLAKYGSNISVAAIPGAFKEGLVAITANYSAAGYTALWLFSLLGLPFMLANKKPKADKILLSFVLFSFLTVVPGFHFRNHYFITLMPAAALSIAVFFDFFNGIFVHKLKLPGLVFASFAAFILLAGAGIKANADYLFRQDNNISCKQIYGANPFVESIEIADYLKNNTKADDKIAVLGSEPQILFYSDRYSATGYIYTYNLVELHSYALTMQKEMANEIEANKPRYIVYVNIKTSWLFKPKSETFIFDWADGYVKKYYKLAARLDALPNRVSRLKTGQEMQTYQPQSQDMVYVFERIVQPGAGSENK